MRKSILVAAFALGVGGVSVARADAPPMVRNSAAAAAPNHHTSLTVASRKFVERAASDNEAEVKLGRLALEKSSNPQVKQFAQMLIDDHSKSLDKLKTVSNDATFPVPTSPTTRQGADYQRLAALSGDQFDQQFMAYMVKDHQHAIDTFQKAAGNLSDASIKGYAEDTLPTLREHLDHAKSIRDSIGQK